MILHENYLEVKSFLAALKETQRLSAETLDRYWFYARHLLIWADEHPLAEAYKIRPGFAAYLTDFRHGRDQLPLVSSDMRKIAQVSRRALKWLKASNPSEYKDLTVSWIDSLQPPRRGEAHSQPEFVSLEEALALGSVQVAPANLALRRDRAASGLLFLSGMRASALCTLPISCLDLERGTVKQFHELGVKTKNSKSAETYLLPIPRLIEVARDWDDLVRRELPGDAAWYAPIFSSWGEQKLTSKPPGKNRNIALERRMRRLFAYAGLAYKSPHKFRHGNAVYGLQHARTIADYKAVSMNLMHADIRMTDAIYAVLSNEDVRARIASLSSLGREVGNDQKDLESRVKGLSREELGKLLMVFAEQLVKRDEQDPGGQVRG